MLNKIIPFEYPLVCRDDFFGPMESTINKVLNDMFNNIPGMVKSGGLGDRGYPKTDIYQDKDDLVIECFVPFVKKEDLRAGLRENILTVSGEIHHKTESTEYTYFRKELRRSSFVRKFILPDNVLKKYTEMTAVLIDGVLTIRLLGAYTPDLTIEPEVKEINIK